MRLFISNVTENSVADVKRRAVTIKQGRDLSRKYNCPHVETSAVRIFLKISSWTNDFKLKGLSVDVPFKQIVSELRYGKKVS